MDYTARQVEDITYAVVMVHKGKAYTEVLKFKELFFYDEDEEEREVVFALQEDFENIIKLSLGEQLPVRVVRDLNEYGVIERIA